MQSINDPKVIGNLMQESCQDHEGVIVDIIGLLKALLLKEHGELGPGCHNDRAGHVSEEVLQVQFRHSWLCLCGRSLCGKLSKVESERRRTCGR